LHEQIAKYRSLVFVHEMAKVGLERAALREHLLPLAPKGAALVTGLVDRAKHMADEKTETGSLWRFSTHGRIKMTETTPGKRVAEISTAMQVEPFDLRDIRRTVETMLAGMGISRDTRAQLLSHGISGVQATHYDRHSYTSEKRAALVSWENRIGSIENHSTMQSNIVALCTAR